MNPREQDLAYYVTAYRLEGHTTWRMCLGTRRDHFEIEQKNWGAHVRVTAVKRFRFDRVTGKFVTSKS